MPRVVGPARSCVRADGTPKKVYASEADALAALGANTKLYNAYQCRQGHWHIGNRARRSAFCLSPGCNAMVPYDTERCAEHAEPQP